MYVRSWDVIMAAAEQNKLLIHWLYLSSILKFYNQKKTLVLVITQKLNTRDDWWGLLWIKTRIPNDQMIQDLQRKLLLVPRWRKDRQENSKRTGEKCNIWNVIAVNDRYSFVGKYFCGLIFEIEPKLLALEDKLYVWSMGVDHDWFCILLVNE